MSSASDAPQVVSEVAVPARPGTDPAADQAADVAVDHVAAADRPPQYPTAECSSCKAPIVWATTASLRSIPVDAEPVGAAGGGNVLLSPGSPTPRATVVGSTQQHLLFGRRWVFRSHFSTCPNADRHRNPRARATNRGRS